MKRVLLLALTFMTLFALRAEWLSPKASTADGTAQITEFPWQEGFENSGGQLPEGWSIEHVNGVLDWNVAAGGRDSEWKVNIPFGNGPITRLVTPVMNLQALDNPVLKFWRFQPPWGTIVDILRVYYRTSASDEWKLLKTFDDAASEWSECIVNLIDASATYQVAFEAELKFANGISLDDITVEQAAPAPVISGPNPLKLGEVHNNLPWPHTGTYTVKNNGTLPLTVSAASSLTNGLSVSGLPVTIQSLQSADISVSLDASSLADGAYSGSFTLDSDDPLTPHFTVNVTGDVAPAVISNYIEENFNDVDPKGWGTVACVKIQEGGIANSACIRALLHQNQPQGGVQTSYVTMGSAPKVEFNYKVIDYDTNAPAAEGAMDYSVLISKDGGNTFEALVSGKTQGGKNQYTKVSADAAKYAGELCLIQIVFEPIEGTQSWLYIDDITVGTKPANELAAISVTGDRVPVPGVASNYVVTVENKGSKSQSNYRVSLVKEDGTQISTVSGSAIAAGETRDFTLSWTPEKGGTAYVAGKVFLANDEYADNDLSQMLKVYVRENGVEPVAIGDGDKNVKYPYNLSMRESLTQTIYLANEINTNGGDIYALEYQADIAHKGANLKDVGIEIWMGETDLDNLKDGWVDPSTLTKVFDGTLSFPAGQYKVSVPLDRPYNYRGRNLVVYSHRKDSYNGEYEDNFVGTDMPGSYRSIAYTTFVGGVTPMTPPAFSEGEHGIPNTTFIMNMSGKGAMHGVVTDENGPVSNAEVRIFNTQLYTLTNDKGEYSFSTLNGGDCWIMVSKYGYNSASEYVTVQADGNLEKNISLKPLDRYTVSGRVTGPSGEDPLAGAKVSLKGYADYSATTDAEGKYLIEGVYSSFLGYTMEVRMKGYETYNDFIMVMSGNVETNVQLAEKAYPVVGLNATKDADGAHLTWNAPVGYESKNYIYDDGSFETGWRNTNMNLTAAFGTLFDEGESGEISSVDIYGLAPQMGEASPTRTLTVEVFNADRQLLGESAPFILPANDWINVPLDDIPYDGPFYVMLKWSPSDAGDSNFIGYDQDGPYASKGTDYYYDSSIGWTTIYAMSEGIRGTMMIRANVEAEALKPAAKGKRLIPEGSRFNIPAPVQYKVYRMPKDADKESWTELGVVQTTSYTDAAWNDLADGFYQYGVVAAYFGEKESVARLTPVLSKGMDTDVTISVTTNSKVPAKGALVTLVNIAEPEDLVYNAVVEGESVTFPEVRKGTYTLTVSLDGFDKWQKTDVEISASTQMNVELIESIITPYGLKVDATEKGSFIFSWNNDPETESKVSYWKEPNYSNLGSLYQKKGEAYGVIFDLADYSDAYLKKIDFYNAPWGHDGSSDYRVIVINPEDGTVLYQSETLSTTVQNDWEKEILLDVDGNMAGKQIGVFIEPLSGTADDSAPVLSADNISTNEHSYRLDMASMTPVLIRGSQSEFSEYLINLWISNEDGSMAKLRASDKTYPEYTVWLDDVVNVTTTATSREFVGLASGNHKAAVKATYATGESPVASIDFNVDYSGLGNVAEGGVKISANRNLIHFENNAGRQFSSLAVVDMSGLVVFDIDYPESGDIYPALLPGCYLVILKDGDKVAYHTTIYLTE